MTMERKIGEIFEYNGEWYQCINTGNCSECAFTGKRCYDFSTKGVDIIGDCTGRTFKKLEKVGEPYDDCGTILQRFKIYTNVTNADTKGLELHIYSNDTIGIEIKGNKENMKKKNLKPFALEAAKAGKPVYTRDGHKARIICFDKNNLLPIVALVTGEDGLETVFQYYSNGQTHEYVEHPEDLMMLIEKKEGWVNLYKSSAYSTKEEAMKYRNKHNDYIDTIKISWEE